MPRHRTGRERHADASAQTALARVRAHITPPAPETDDETLGRAYPYVTAARARDIRHELETRRD